jgi:membrane-anchored protein YejM (alkaline phosphatase superfamily)
LRSFGRRVRTTREVDRVRRNEADMSWRSAVVRAAILLVASVVAFVVVPDRLLAYLSLHVAPAVRDLLVTGWIAVAFVGVAVLFVRLQGRRTA